MYPDCTRYAYLQRLVAYEVDAPARVRTGVVGYQMAYNIRALGIALHEDCDVGHPVATVDRTVDQGPTWANLSTLPSGSGWSASGSMKFIST